MSTDFQNLIILEFWISVSATKVLFPVLRVVFPSGCAMFLNLHLLCGICNFSAKVQSPTHIIIHLFSGTSWGIYQRDTEGSIDQRIHHVHLENAFSRKAHKNKKAWITLLAKSEWTDCFCFWGELKHHSFWVPISHLWRTTGHWVQFLFLSFLLVLKMPGGRKWQLSGPYLSTHGAPLTAV